MRKSLVWIGIALTSLIFCVSAMAQTNLALNKPTQMSSVYSSEFAGAMCVDGNKGNFCHSTQEPNPWWQVDLQGNYAISEIVVANRSGYGERSRTLNALLSADGQSWQRIYTHNGTDFATLRIPGGNRTARFVRLQLAANEYLNLSEVEVYGSSSGSSGSAYNPIPTPVAASSNVALNKPTQMSSVYSSEFAGAMCVDGNKGNFCHSTQEPNPWWQVDLQGNYAISEIVVANRSGYGERSRTLNALLSADGQSWQRIYTHNGTDFATLRIPGGNRTARFVRLQLAANEYLNLSEVEVYGSSSGSSGSAYNPIPTPVAASSNVALNKPTQMSSVYSSEFAGAMCVDGNKGNFCHSTQEPNPWWQVDLQGNYAISEIVVANRSGYGERSRTLNALLSADGQSWQRIYTHNGTDFATLRIPGGNRTARFVRLQLAANEYLNLSEVEVYGSSSGSSGSAYNPIPTPVAASSNVALNKPTQMSSVYSSEFAGAMCVDGNKGNFCHSTQEPNPWWQVDLQGNYAISEIVVANRSGYGERSRTLNALLSADGQSWQRIYTHNGTDFATLRIPGGNRTARFVRLQLAANEYLNLSEVEVYGSSSGSSGSAYNPIPTPVAASSNVALNKPTQMSSVYSSEFAGAMCVDGNKGNFCHSTQEPNPWWQVDLQGNYAISEIVVANRSGYGERSRTLNALLSADGQSWQRIYTHNGTDFATLRIPGGNRTARFVRLQLAANEYLNLSEVEVYGSSSGSSGH